MFHRSAILNGHNYSALSSEGPSAPASSMQASRSLTCLPQEFLYGEPQNGQWTATVFLVRRSLCPFWPTPIDLVPTDPRLA